MLHIILGILKVIFILIGIVLGLILGVVLIALFVPVRYRVQAVKDDGRLQVRARITFLLHILSVRITAGLGEAPGIAVRVFGILLPLFGNKKQRKKGRRRGAPSRKRNNSNGDAAAKNAGADANENITAIEVQKDSDPDSAIEEPDHPDSERAVTAPHPDSLPEAVPEDDRSAGLLQRLLRMLSVLLQRLRAVGDRIQAVFGRLRDLWKRLAALPERLRQLWERLCRLARKPGELLEFLQEYEVRAILGDTLVYLKRLLKHYIPRRLKGWIKFGTGDPALTGELTGVLYLLLPVRAAEFSVEPDFTEKFFETELDAAGHIRACHLIYVLIRMICDRRVRRLIRAYRKRK